MKKKNIDISLYESMQIKSQFQWTISLLKGLYSLTISDENEISLDYELIALFPRRMKLELMLSKVKRHRLEK